MRPSPLVEPSRARDKKKYSVDRSGGPLVLVGELLQKRLIQHCWPCAYLVRDAFGGPVLLFGPSRGRSVGPDFDSALEIAVRVLSSETGARIASVGRKVWLEGDHYIGSDGYPKYGVSKPEVYDMAKIIRASGPVERAILHCAAVPGDWYKAHTAKTAMATVRRWHKARGWAEEGYHYLIMPKGEIARGRAVERDGAHTYGHNRNTLGILLIESRRVDFVGEFEDYFTPEQDEAVRRILSGHEIGDVKGHNDFAAKLCPGFKVEHWF